MLAEIYTALIAILTTWFCLELSVSHHTLTWCCWERQTPERRN